MSLSTGGGGDASKKLENFEPFRQAGHDGPLRSTKESASGIGGERRVRARGGASHPPGGGSFEWSFEESFVKSFCDFPRLLLFYVKLFYELFSKELSAMGEESIMPGRRKVKEGASSAGPGMRKKRRRWPARIETICPRGRGPPQMPPPTPPPTPP